MFRNIVRVLFTIAIGLPFLVIGYVCMYAIGGFMAGMQLFRDLHPLPAPKKETEV